jgi:hypothetical protein
MHLDDRFVERGIGLEFRLRDADNFRATPVPRAWAPG